VRDRHTPSRVLFLDEIDAALAAQNAIRVAHYLPDDLPNTQTIIVTHNPQTITIAEALRSYTWNGAFLTHDEDDRGSLEPGKLADLVILDLPGLNALEEDPELLFPMRERVAATLVGGELVHGSLPDPE